MSHAEPNAHRLQRDAKAIVFPLLLCAVFVSCAWNKQFLQPERIPPTAKVGTSINPATGDTLLLHLSGPAYQPSFTNARNEPLALPYTIESAMFGNPINPLNGWLVKPTTPSEQPLITLLFLHGNGGNIITEYPAVLPFVQRGFQVFLFDYSGYGLSGGKATRSNVLRDAATALEYLKSRTDVAGTPIVIYGQSLGGHTAALMASGDTAAISAIVIEGGFASYKDIAGATTRTGFLAQLLVKEGPLATKALSNYHGPVLVVHSREDRVVPIAMGRELFTSANTPKEFYEVNGPHISGPLLYADPLVGKIKELIQRR